MHELIHTDVTGSAAVHRAAATVVDEAVRAAVVDALKAAHLCRCRRCRTEAVRTYAWAVGILGLDGRERGR
jgi:hypothetical protein